VPFFKDLCHKQEQFHLPLMESVVPGFRGYGNGKVSYLDVRMPFVAGPPPGVKEEKAGAGSLSIKCVVVINASLDTRQP